MGKMFLDPHFVYYSHVQVSDNVKERLSESQTLFRDETRYKEFNRDHIKNKENTHSVKLLKDQKN